MEHLIVEIGLVIIFSSLFALVLYYLKQPLILAYIFAGILLGPYGLGFITDPEFVNGIADVGIMLMLFLVGLEMNTSRLKELGLVSLVAGIGQVVFTSLIGFAIIMTFDFTLIQGVYLAIALTFSSTVIAVKIMSDKNDLKSLYGQICIGILIVQDLLAIIALFVLAGFKEGSFAFDYMHFSEVFIKGIFLGIGAILIAKKLLQIIFNKIATSQELLILFSLGWCFLISLLSIKIGFSMEIGAFLAGISLSNLPYTFEINSKAKILRNFFITVFFAALGASMIFDSVGPYVNLLIILSLFVLIGNPLIIIILMHIMGYDKRVAFFTGLAVANISEFSLIVIALGGRLGHLDQTIISMVAIIAIITMIVSSYMITYNNELYNLFKKTLSFIKSKAEKKTSTNKNNLNNHIVLLGCGQMGEQILEQIISFKDNYIVVDHDNQVIKKLIDENINCIFGDVEDEELLEELNLEDAEIIISTLPNIEDNYFLLRFLQNIDKDKKPLVIAVAGSAREGIKIFNRGVDSVILKPYLGAHQVHHLNKELYKIKSNLKHAVITKDIQHSKHCSEHDLAILLDKLNALRLDEIKKKIVCKKNYFQKKKN